MNSGQGSDRGIKANELAVEALKQLLTLASAALALSIAFIKDALGTDRTRATYIFLIPVAWGLFAIVIWSAWVAIPDACKKMAERSSYVFAEGRPRVLAQIAQWSFLLGLTLLTLFAVINFRLFFSAQEVVKSAAP